MHYIRLIEYGSCDYEEMIRLRDIVLRKPLGLYFSANDLQQEIKDVLIGCFETDDLQQDKGLIGCCILSPVDEELVRLRQMAVSEHFQRSGVGREIMEFAEKQAAANGFVTIMMHARKTAVSFYERIGYHIVGEEFLEVGIPHYEMRKKLQ